MSAVPFRSGREGLYANVGDTTFLVRRTSAGFQAHVNGYPQAEPRSSQKAALADAQALARRYASSLDPMFFATHTDANGRPTAISHDGDRDYPYHPTPCCGAAASINDGPMYCKACYAEVEDWYGGVPAEPLVPLAISTNAPEGETTTNPTSQEAPMTATTETPKTTRKTAAKTGSPATPATRKRKTRAATGSAPAPKPSNRDEVLRLHGEEKKISEIAEALSISQGRVRQILMDSGLIKVTSRNPERDARIVAAIDAGESPADVAEREGVKEFRVRWIHKVAKAGAA